MWLSLPLVGRLLNDKHPFFFVFFGSIWLVLGWAGVEAVRAKKKLGLPDARFDVTHPEECVTAEQQATKAFSDKLATVDVETLVRTITKSVLEALGAK